MIENISLLDGVHFSEVFRNASGVIYQSDSEGCWYIDFAGKTGRFDYRGLLQLKRSIYGIDTDQHFLRCDRSSDLEILSFYTSDQVYVLNSLEIIAFRDLLEGTFAMFQLNQLINDCLRRCIV